MLRARAFLRCPRRVADVQLWRRRRRGRRLGSCDADLHHQRWHEHDALPAQLPRELSLVRGPPQSLVVFDLTLATFVRAA